MLRLACLMRRWRFKIHMSTSVRIHIVNNYLFWWLLVQQLQEALSQHKVAKADEGTTIMSGIFQWVFSVPDFILYIANLTHRIVSGERNNFLHHQMPTLYAHIKYVVHHCQQDSRMESGASNFMLINSVLKSSAVRFFCLVWHQLHWD